MSYPKIFFRSLDLRSQISKRIMWIISKSLREKFFFDIFAIHSSSRHKKRCQISVRLFSLFPGSIYQQWKRSTNNLLILCIIYYQLHSRDNTFWSYIFVGKLLQESIKVTYSYQVTLKSKHFEQGVIWVEYSTKNRIIYLTLFYLEFFRL